jgi:hypothetical protein
VPRTTPELVRTVIDLPAGVDVTSYILTANELVTDQCRASLYSPERFELIERWLAAHYAASNLRRTSSNAVTGGAVGVQQSFDRPQVDLHLNNTTYGQTAMELDTDGNLAAYNNSLSVVKKPLPTGKGSVAWLGSAPLGYFYGP